MKKVNFFAIISLVVLILGFFIPGLLTKNLTTLILICIIFNALAFILAIAAIIYAHKIEKSKAPGIILLIISFIITGLFGLMYFGMNIIQDPEQNEDFCEQLVNCKKGKKDISTCYVIGDKEKTFPVKCKDENLDDDQYKK